MYKRDPTPNTAQPFPKQFYQETWEVVFDAIPDLVSIIDVNCIIVRVNRAMAGKLGCDPADVIGKRCYELIHGTDHPLPACPHSRLLANQEPVTTEVNEPKMRGTYLVSATPLHAPDGTLIGSLHILRDLSEQKRNEEKLQQINQELRELSLSRNTLFALIAHDLRSPFQGLLGFIELLKDDFDDLDRDQVRHYLDNVSDSAGNLFSLLENLLEWLRIQTGRMQFEPQVISLRDLGESIADQLIGNARQKNIQIVNHLPHIKVKVDPRMARSILLNLVSNAIKFSNPGNKVMLTSVPVEMEGDDDNRETLPDGFVEVNVIDSGVGMPPQTVEKLFKPEHHISSSGTLNEPGTGLGLKIVRDMVLRHGGEMRARSEEGKGSVFIFSLPLA